MRNSAFSCCLALLLCLSFPLTSSAEQRAIGKVKGLRGLVSILRDGKTKPAFPNDRIYQSDTILTGSDGAIGILLDDNTLISMGPISRVSMEKYTFAPASNEYAMRLNMQHGTFVYQSGLLGKLAPHAVELDTPVGRISMLKEETNFKARFAE
ncbi:MAG: FecR domain-containing protein [Desulforhopalus sp.]|nr:FecR domain-containing protein [Desulforhopalus sp.]